MLKNTIVHISSFGKNGKKCVPTALPVLFLAGPIRNAPKWHDEAIRYILNINKELFCAVPVRKVNEEILPFIEKVDTTFGGFDRQRAWELHYLYEAAAHGCVVFWLPKEEMPKEFPDKVYAHITMMELGGWIARKKENNNINLVVGTDGEFPEWNTVKFDLENETPTVPICRSIEETIDMAVKLIG